MPDALLDIAGGDPARAAVLRRQLELLADRGDEKLREMAHAVLHDGAPLRDLALSEAYGNELGAAFDHFWIRYQAMTSDEQAELRDLGRRQLEEATGA